MKLSLFIALVFGILVGCGRSAKDDEKNNFPIQKYSTEQDSPKGPRQAVVALTQFLERDNRNFIVGYTAPFLYDNVISALKSIDHPNTATANSVPKLIRIAEELEFPISYNDLNNTDPRNMPRLGGFVVRESRDCSDLQPGHAAHAISDFSSSGEICFSMIHFQKNTMPAVNVIAGFIHEVLHENGHSETAALEIEVALLNHLPEFFKNNYESIFLSPLNNALNAIQRRIQDKSFTKDKHSELLPNLDSLQNTFEKFDEDPRVLIAFDSPTISLMKDIGRDLREAKRLLPKVSDSSSDYELLLPHLDVASRKIERLRKAALRKAHD